ncbi:MAG: TetR/AcrR family transcriptional regulator [Candidatus Promineifilaceae bacterium]
MARTRDPQRREQFLQAALRLFVERGVGGTSTAAIAREAGSATGTLFLYFPTKQDLINELILEISREQSAFIRSLLTPEMEARQMFYTIWRGSIDWFLEHRDNYQYQQQVRDSVLLDEAVIQQTAVNLGYYFQAVEKGRHSGAIKPYSVELVGGFFYQGIVAVMNLLRDEPDAARREQLINDGFDIFWNGIKEFS